MSAPTTNPPTEGAAPVGVDSFLQPRRAAFWLLLFFLAGLNMAFYILWFLSLSSMLLQFPRLRNWEELARQANRLSAS